MSGESRLSLLLDRWQRSLDAGEPVPPRELCRDCPDLLDELERTIAVLQRVERLASTLPTPPPSDQGPPTRAPLEGEMADTLVPEPSRQGPLPAAPGYEILAVLGKGGAGVVYRARQTDLNREVALKMILAGSHACGEERQRFLVEAKSVAALQHPGIVQVYDFGTIGEAPFFAMEYCPGGTLAQKLHGQPLDFKESVRLVEQVARAMQAAHEAGIVHRDLKPGNILLDRDGQPKVTDFGLAKRIDSAGLTVTGTILGTPSYMAPEQARGVKEIGLAVDVYALGAILYECLTGRPPFLSANHHDVLMQVVFDDPVSVRQLNALAPRDLETICQKCLNKEPGKRYASAKELADDLHRWLTDEPILARPIGPVGKSLKWVRRRPLIAGLAAATLLALVGGVVVSFLFALKASDRERVALEQKEEARAALAASEESRAVGLLRPLGHYTDVKPLNDFELDALDELASLPEERDRVRILFIARALEHEGTTGQLGRRLEEALIAAVSLRSDLRARVLDLARNRLRDQSAPLTIRIVSSCLLAELHDDDPESVADACGLLARHIGSGEEALPIGKSFLALAARRPAGAGELARKTLETTTRTADPIALRTLAQGFALLAGKLAPEESSALAKEVLSRAGRNNNPEMLPTLAKTFAVLAHRVSAAQAADLAHLITRTAEGSSDPDVLAFLTNAFLELAGKLSTAQAGKRASALAKRIGRRLDKVANPGVVTILAGALSALADKLAAASADESAQRILPLLTRKTPSLSRDEGPSKGEPPSGSPLKTFTRLAKQLSPLAASAAAQRLGGLAAKTNEPVVLGNLVEAFLALADKLPAQEAAGEAQALARRITEVPEKTRPSEFVLLGQSLSALSSRLGLEAGAHAARFVGELTRRAGKTNDPDVLLSYAKAFAALAGKLSATESAELAKTLSKIAAGPPDPDVLATLAEAFAALAGKLPADSSAKHAADLARPLVKLAGQTADADILGNLSRAFVPLSRRLPAEEQRKYALTLARQLVGLMGKSEDSERLASLSATLTLLTGKLPTGDVGPLARSIVEVANKTSDPTALRSRTAAFLDLSARLPAGEVESPALTLARRISLLMSRQVGSEGLRTLAEVFSLLANKLPSEEQSKAASLFEQQIDRRAGKSDNPAEMAALVAAFAGVAGQLPPENRTRTGELLINRLGPMAHKDRDARSMRRLLDALGDGISPAVLVALLKHPGCVEPVRSLVVERLGRLFHRPFRDVWELADYLAEHEPRLDVAAPLPESRQTPRAGSRGSFQGGGPAAPGNGE
jgi:predicted Ser/Thr protein kinase